MLVILVILIILISELYQLLIEKVDIFDEKNEMGRWGKAIHFSLPIIDYDIDFILDNEIHAEAVVKLTRNH